MYKGREICIKSGTTGREYLPVVILKSKKRRTILCKKTKRWLSGVLAALICCPSIFSSVQIARAAEIAKPEIKTSPVTENLEPEGAELYNSNLTTLPDMDTVKEELYGDEIVLAETLELKKGSDFKGDSDFTNLTFNKEKVKIEYKGAFNEKLEEIEYRKRGVVSGGI